MATNRSIVWPMSVLLGLLLIAGIPLLVNAQEEGDIQAQLVPEFQQDTLSITASAVNLSETAAAGLSYEFSASRTDANGNRSTNRQSGSFELAPNERGRLSTLHINMGQAPQVMAQLRVRNAANEVIAEDKITLSPSPTEPSPQGQQQGRSGERSFHAEDIELNGIFVLDNTRTRAGHDFYDLIYQSIGQLEMPGSFQIVLEELPGQGISSTIQIFLNGQLVFYNNLNPKYDFLVELANYSSQVLINRMSNYQQFQDDDLEGGGSEAY